jgi:hypothetical protein
LKFKKTFGNSGQVALRFKNSESFLTDANAELNLGGTNPWSIWICRIMFWTGLAALIGILGLAFYIWMWDSSPLTKTVEADIVGLDKKSKGAVVEYKYEVEGNDYSTKQRVYSTKSSWKKANAKAEVVCLSFMPGTSKLKKSIERMDWSILFLGPILPLGFILGGCFGNRETKSMARIEENATHILSGEVTNRIRSKGVVIVQYKNVSPETGKEIFGGV